MARESKEWDSLLKAEISKNLELIDTDIGLSKIEINKGLQLVITLIVIIVSMGVALSNFSLLSKEGQYMKGLIFSLFFLLAILFFSMLFYQLEVNKIENLFKAKRTWIKVKYNLNKKGEH